MSSSLDHSGGHYSLPPNNTNSGNNTNTNNSNNSGSINSNTNNSNGNNNSSTNPNDHSNNTNNQYGLGYLGQQQQQPQRQQQHHSPQQQQQQQIFYPQQDIHQRQQQQRHPNQQYPQQHSSSSTSPNTQYNPTPQDQSRQGHYNQHPQQLQQFDGYGQQGHYQDQTQQGRGQQQQQQQQPQQQPQQQLQQQQGQGQSGYSQDQPDLESNSTSVSGSSTPRSESGSSLRFRISLEAQTAAMQRQDETPVTYLNKGQFYTIGLQDTEDYDGEVTSVIKVTFHDASHRRLAARYWSFWLSQQSNPKTARALDIEKASSSGILEVQSKTFDRISFKWNGKAGAKLMVRFNCLSTDFSRIKGVKGIPLRVHIDTYLEGNGQNKVGSGGGDQLSMERSFAKIKLFRDKGAERKNKDDHKHLEKMWDKMRGKNADTNPLVNILAPVQSMSIFSECIDHPEGSGEDETLDLSDTLSHDVGVEGGMSNSGGEGGDGGDGGDGGSGNYSNNDAGPSSRLGSDSLLDSPTSGGGDPTPASSTSGSKKRRRVTESGSSPGINSNSNSNSNTNSNNNNNSNSNGNGGFYDSQQSQAGFASSFPSSTAMTIAGTGTGSGIGAGGNSGALVASSDQFLDRDPSYVPQARKKRPVLCLYIKIGGESVYRAVYLEKYTLTDLISKLSEKLEIQSSTISCVYRKTIKKELLVRVDDSMVAQMTDELDMVVEYDFNQQDGSVNLTLKY
ncbi:grainyhead-like [Mortierella sp. AM989]|nr:grainyhead-like [Mortierella sp. AM989]